MGKTKNKRHKMKQPCPTGLPSVREIEKEEEMMGTREDDGGGLGASSTQTIQNIIEKLQGVSVEEKECACCNVATLIEDPEGIPLVLDNGVIKMIGPLLLDPSVVVRHSAAGTLRNLSVAGGPDVCDVMVEEDVMTPLVTLIKQYQEGCPITKKKVEKVDTKLEILVEAINLLWNLCESNNTALLIFNREKLINIIYQYLQSDVYGNELAIATAHCLHAVSEDNTEATDDLNQPLILEHMEKIINCEGNAGDTSDASFILLKLLISGIYINTKNGKFCDFPGRMSSVIMEIISQALDLNCNLSVATLGEKLFQRKNKDLKNDVDLIEDDEVKKLNSTLISALTVQSVALEILTNICNDDSADDWDDLDSSDASDEGLHCELSMDCDGYSSEKFPLMVSSDIHEAIVCHNFFTKVVGKITSLGEDVVQRLSSDALIGHPILKRFTTLYCRALLCLHNLVSCLDIEDLGGPSHLYNVWKELAHLTFRHTYVCPKNAKDDIYCNSPEHIQFLEAVTSALRAILQKLIQVRSFQLQELSSSDVSMLCALTEKCTETNIRNNIVNTMGAIGNSLAKCELANSSLIIKDIGLFLLDLCTKDTDVIIMAEALDAIFDVFGEDNTDSIAHSINLVERLKQVLPVLRSKMSTQRKSLAHHYPVIVTVRTNLARFIKYKSEHHQTNGHT